MKMEFRKKTTATILIALFMISTFAVAYVGAVIPGEHLVADGEPGNEERIVIDMPADFTLGDLETLSWSVYTVSGYPAHVDIILEDDIDGVANIDSLTAELAENVVDYTKIPAGQTYGTWLKTFEGFTDGPDKIDDSTVLWVTRLGGGTNDAPYGTLAELKAGTVTNLYGDPAITIDQDVVILRLEIEVDYWPARDGTNTVSEVYIDNIQVNDVSTDLLLEVLPPIVSIMVSPASVDFGKLKYGEDVHKEVTVFNLGDIDVTVEVFKYGTFFIDNLDITGPGEIAPGGNDIAQLDLTVPYEATAGIKEGTLVFQATPKYPTP